MAIAVNQKSAEILHPANPLSIFPYCLQRGQIAAVENVPGRGPPFSLLEMVPGITGVDGHELEHTRIAVTVDHAAGATVANPLRIVPFIYVAHRCLPKVAAVKVEVPVQVEILVAAEAAEFFRLLPQMPLHFAQRLGRIHDRITALPLHLLDLLENLDEFVGPIT